MIPVEYALLRIDDAPLSLDTFEAAERDRAARFASEAARRRFVAVRHALRVELGRRLSVPPHDVRLVYGDQGKPALAAPFDRAALTFSVAHAGELALLAFARGVAIGADLERVRDVPRADEIARRVFSDAERASGETFFRLWTRREALVKCVGGSVLRATPGSAGHALADVPVPRGYVAAICVAAPALNLRERPLYSAR